MTLEKRSAARQEIGELLALVRNPEVVLMHPTVAGVEFSVEVERYVADALIEIAGREGMSVDELCTEIHFRYTPGLPLSMGVRTYTLNYYRNQVAA